MNFLNQKRRPKRLGIELISVDLTSGSFGIDSEGDLFRKQPKYLNINPKKK
ncbi:MAG: hypothetical protein RL662_1729 [Bacteroidota bacterium]